MAHNMVILVLVLTYLGFDLAAADNHPSSSSSCFDDLDSCATHVGEILNSEDAFWFGERYAKECGPGSFGTSCTNPDPPNLSILRRLYNASGDSGQQQIDKNTRGLTVLDVMFPKEDGEYYGCGHHFAAPGTGFRLDPTKVTTTDSWTLDLMPTLKWEAEDDALYTIIIWDVGYFYSHGILINAKGGSTDNGYDAVDKYHGPIVPIPRPNVLLFAVFKQTTVLNQGMVAGIMGMLLGSNVGALPVSEFLAGLNGMIAEMVAANVMAVVGDAYSMERQKNIYIVNGCPYLITQAPVLKTILREAGIDAMWSDDAATLGYKQPSHLATLTTDITVEYSMEKDLVVDSCCVKKTFTQSLYRPDPLGTRLTSPALTRMTPRVRISPINILTDIYGGIRRYTYTLMMVDMTDSSNMIIHWMVTDIAKVDVASGNEVLPYLGPNPFNSDQPRTYMFFLLKQNVDKLDVSSLTTYASSACPNFIQYRCGAQVGRMLRDWDLEEIVGITWFQAEQDAYARKRLYSELLVKPMFDVCDGQPGFEDPCPQEQYCVSRSGVSTILPMVSGLLLTTFTTIVLTLKF